MGIKEPESQAPVGYLIEKSEGSLYSCARLIDKINEMELSARNREHLYAELHPLLYDLTKVVASLEDATKVWDAGLAKRMCERGTEELKSFMSRVREFCDGFIDPNELHKGSLKEPI